MSENRQLQESVKRAMAALRDKQAAQALQDMRKDIARSEERVVDFVCACSGAPFHVRFARASTVERFRIAAIVRGGQPRQEPAPSSNWVNSEPAPSASFDLGELDLSGWECPWCQVSKMTGPFSFVHCNSCRGLVCGGRAYTMPNGKGWFVCQDRCGDEGEMVPKLKRVDGQEQSRKRLHRPSVPPKLPANNTPRLSGPRK